MYPYVQIWSRECGSFFVAEYPCLAADHDKREIHGKGGEQETRRRSKGRRNAAEMHSDSEKHSTIFETRTERRDSI